MAACIMRAIWSDAPPAPAATTISTGLGGSQAAGKAAVATPASTPAHKPIAVSLIGMVFLLGYRGSPEPLAERLSLRGWTRATRSGSCDIIIAYPAAMMMSQE